MTQYPPKTFFLQRIFQAIEVVLQNTRIQMRGPNAGGDFHDTIFRTQQPKHIFFCYFILLINQIYVPHTNVV